MEFVMQVFRESWGVLKDSSVYILFGIAVGGMLRVFLSPGAVAKHLGGGRFSSIFKAALLGVPVPLCSCGVLPAAASLKRQGANNGAVTAFLISTPESGVDSIAISYALLDPVMTLARPISAFATAAVAGVAENLLEPPDSRREIKPDLSCPVDNCCSGEDCPPEIHARHHTFFEKIRAGFGYAFGELWGDLASWFLVGVVLAGLISAWVPSNVMARYLGGGLHSMLLMLVVGIPLYICATASTPIAAALIMKGVSPGAALVFLLVGPATNATSLTVLVGMLGKRATALYLASIAVLAVLCGLAVDQVYAFWHMVPQAVVGQAAELIPAWLQWVGALAVLAISVRPVSRSIGKWFGRSPYHHDSPCGCGVEGDGGEPHESHGEDSGSGGAA